MDHREKREYMLSELMAENPQYRGMTIPKTDEEQKSLLRALMNVRPPKEISQEFLCVQDEYLKEDLASRGTVGLDDMEDFGEGIYLWQGDITRFACDAIVNAANSAMTGCYIPNYSCIDNCINTYAGIQLRLECAEIMEKQGEEEPTGSAKITGAYNLPCKYVIHTVGPIVRDRVTEKDRDLISYAVKPLVSIGI
ncbi:MAG: macro domain-containing protein [Eggerthellaceae bacterium]|nr:macro domain-containing protein [Eggerthellaceae bacterium]